MVSEIHAVETGGYSGEYSVYLDRDSGFEILYEKQYDTFDECYSELQERKYVPSTYFSPSDYVAGESGSVPILEPGFDRSESCVITGGCAGP